MPYILSMAIALMAASSTGAAIGQRSQPSEYHWIRGIVSSSSSDAITIALRGGDLTLAVNAATELVAPLARGTAVSVHYIDRPRRMAVAVFPDPSHASPMSLNEAGISARGTVAVVKKDVLSMTVGGRTQTYVLDKGTAMLTRDGRVLAATPADIASQLAAGATVLVSYSVEQTFDAAGQLTAEYFHALQIRTMP